VLAGNFGSPLRSDYTVLGHPVNLASRLTGIAPARQILLGEDTRRLAGEIAQTEPLGDASLKNVSMPIPAYRLMGLNPQAAFLCLECGEQLGDGAACPRCGTPRFAGAGFSGDGLLTVAAVQATLTGKRRSTGPRLIAVGGPYQGADLSVTFPCSLGRDALTNQIVLSLDPAVSRRHAVLRRDGERIVLADLGSQNGTFLNDAMVDVAEVRDGDIVTVGRTRLVVSGLRGTA
jgi:hypothetical protein